MTTSPHISVVIPTYQRRTCVERILAALEEQTLPPSEYEVIVSIDGSTDGTKELVEHWSAPYALRVIWHENHGRAAARNAAIELARGALIVSLDDDMQPAPHCLEAHRHAHAHGERVAVLGAVPLVLDAASSQAAGFVKKKFDRHLSRLTQPGYQINFRDFYSGNVSLPRAVLQEVNAFDPAFTQYGNEDSELALRLLAAGVRITYSADALAYQRYTKDFAGLAHDNIAKGHTAVLLASKEPHTFDHLRLRSFYNGSRKWRTLRTALLALSRVWPRTSQLVIRLVQWAEQRHVAWLHKVYDLVLDYFFWLGALPALRANQRAGSGLRSLAPHGGSVRA